jgi:hypothetical protein
MLGFETRMEAHDFLKQHRVSVLYDVGDLRQAQATAQKGRKNS